MKTDDKGILNFLSKQWHLISFFVLAIFWLANMQSQVNTNTKEIIELRTAIATSNTNQIQTQVQLSQIQTDLQWVKLRLSNQ